MSKLLKFIFCKLPKTPYGFNVEAFKKGDPKQIALYKANKHPYRKTYIDYSDLKVGESDRSKLCKSFTRRIMFY